LGDDFDLPKEINKNYCICFLIQTSKLIGPHASFIPALNKIINFLGVKKIPPHLLKTFIPFLKQFKPSNEHSIDDLANLFEFTKTVGSCFEWLSWA